MTGDTGEWTAGACETTVGDAAAASQREEGEREDGRREWGPEDSALAREGRREEDGGQRLGRTIGAAGRVEGVPCRGRLVDAYAEGAPLTCRPGSAGPFDAVRRNEVGSSRKK